MVKQNFYYRFLRFLLKAVFSIFLKVKVIHQGKVKKDQNYVFIGNHSSWIDPLLMFAYLPKHQKITLVGEENSGHRQKFILKLIKLIDMDTIEFDRASNSARIKALKLSAKAAKDGQSLLIFPEGRICRVDGQFYPFFKGSFFIAKRGDAPIMPVYIRGSEAVYFRRNITMVFGDTIETDRKISVEKLTEDTYYYMRNELAPEKPINNIVKKRLDITYLFLVAPPPIEQALMKIPVADGNSAIKHYEQAKALTMKKYDLE